MTQLHFSGKEFVYNHHLSVPYSELKPDAKKSVGVKGEQSRLDGNLIIHGDNLRGLKALLPRYEGKINCIYIDPPYNTGKEGWCYNDNVNMPYLKEWLSNNPINTEDMERHEKWCCMMWPRLTLLRQLLADDGVIFISIDDNEVQHLKMMMDEIFGEVNFITNFIVMTPNQTENSFLIQSRDYLLVYGKEKRKVNTDFEKIKQSARCTTGKESQTQPEIEFPAGLEVEGVKDGIYEQPKQNNSNEDIRAIKGRLVVKNGRLAEPVTLKARWSNPNDIKKIIKELNNDDNAPIYNKFKKELVRLWFKGYKFQPQMDKIGYDIFESIWLDCNKKGSNQLQEIIPDNNFSYPKATDLIIKILKPFGKKITILDSFAGTGTTAHAVLDLNKEDGGNRKFILLECEDYADNITAERVRRVINGIPTAKNKDLQKGLGGDFTYCELSPPIDFDALLAGKNLPSYKEFAGLVWNLFSSTAFDEKQMKEKEFIIGEKDDELIFCFYKPDKQFLLSNESCLNTTRIEQLIEKYPNKKMMVYAPACFVPNAMLAKSNIKFSPLPFALFKLG